METVQKFISDDGREFLDRDQCVSYEALCKEVAEIMSKLAPIPDLPSCGFANGAGYIRHDFVAAQQARRAILRLANSVMPHKWFEQSIADHSTDPSWAGRLISEMSEKCIYQAWYRFSCMTKDFREFGQPYFARHPEEAKDICLNDGAA
jgi:hypothetical protein